ncbi:50S ribosomal protein L29 [Flavobacterium sp. SUN052]|uniref:50S ribosomal protein L29 n=1 Tax=Flavobacterium sp. SUN052 TaxID=3002441 RepID=UPI00237D4801|nr:50S ribosomal protein L29 [Flavobacterium sp. SUN052]MEC4004481.1 50S ribosomal protein L29 [Flavobacterium sp. SUN052]
MKQSEIINLSTADLQAQLNQLKKAYADLKTAHVISPIQNPLQIRTMRRAVARMVTELSKRD